MIGVVTTVFTLLPILRAQELREVSLIDQSQLCPDERREIAGRSSHEFLLRLLSNGDDRSRSRALINELTAMVVGYDFYKPNSDEKTNAEQHAIVDAMVILSRKLRTFRKTYSIMFAAFNESRSFHDNFNNLSKAVSVYCRKIEALVSNDSALHREYIRLKVPRVSNPSVRKALYYEIPKNGKTAATIRSNLLNSIEHIRWVWNRFMAREYETSFVLRALVALCENAEKETALQKIYDETVLITVLSIHEGEEVTFEQTLETFESVLVGKLQENATVAADVQDMINKL